MSPFNNFPYNNGCGCDHQEHDCPCECHDEEEKTDCQRCITCVKGDTGATGPQGVRGVKGDTGPIGPRGEKGDIGPVGPKGDTGPIGPRGDMGPLGPIGPRGDMGLIGPQGVPGLQGPQGLTGATGPQGPAGEKGDTGAVGPKGDTGALGPEGAVGPRGDTGAVGPKGDTGQVGPQGAQGVQGVKGDTGLTGPQGQVGPQGPQGLQGPKGDSGCCCGQPGPTGAMGPIGPSGATGAQGPEGKSGGMICPCEITFGKVASFLLENEFSFEATIDAPFAYTLSSTQEEPAVLYNTWGIEFFEETIVPLCKLEALYLSFSTLQEREAFVSLISVVLNQTLSCCHACGVCDVCKDTLAVDQYHSIVDMPDTCNYEYYLSAECSCLDSTCQAIAKPIDLCNFVNTTGEKLRGILERKKDEGKVVTLISTQKDELLPESINKTIEVTGLSSVLLSYENEGAFDVALICLERVTVLEFTQDTE